MVCYLGYDKNLLYFMEVVSAYGLTLILKKCHTKCSELSFFGNACTNDVMKSHPGKVDRLKQMQETSNKIGLYQLLNWLFDIYLFRFILNFNYKPHNCVTYSRRSLTLSGTLIISKSLRTPKTKHQKHLFCTATILTL